MLIALQKSHHHHLNSKYHFQYIYSRWKLNKKFTVTAQNLKAVKKQIAEDQPDSKQKNYKWVVGVILLSLLGILIAFRWKRGKSHEKN